MEQLIPLVLMGLGWLFIGLPLTLAAKRRRAAEQQAAGQRKPASPPAREVSSPAMSSASLSAGISAQETRLTPSISLTPNDDSIYMGSLNAVTGEGYDPCHEDQMKHPAAAAAEIPLNDSVRLPFGWTGSDIVRGVVISEILNRRKNGLAGREVSQ